MTLTPHILSHADQIIGDIYDGLTNKGAVNSFIETSPSTSDFELPDGFKMRAKEEKSVVFYHIFRAK